MTCRSSACCSPLMDLEGVANWLQVSGDMLYRLSRSGQLPGIKIGGVWRFRQSDVERYLDQRLAERQPSSGQRLPQRDAVQ